MEKREAAQAALDAVDEKIAGARARREAAESKRDAALADIAKEQEFKASGRRPLVADLPADLIALYEKVGAAALRHGRCQGCRIELFGADLARVRSAPADEVLRCEECRRILVRTPESGL
jgi:predicted  nucleic acid-binding Zn-ribbon protein